jgi:hypothetical protein
MSSISLFYVQYPNLIPQYPYSLRPISATRYMLYIMINCLLLTLRRLLRVCRKKGRLTISKVLMCLLWLRLFARARHPSFRIFCVRITCERHNGVFDGVIGFQKVALTASNFVSRQEACCAIVGQLGDDDEESWLQNRSHFFLPDPTKSAPSSSD